MLDWNSICYSTRITYNPLFALLNKDFIDNTKDYNYNIKEVSGASPDLLTNADEIFLTNAIQGIRWVVGIKDKRYFCRVSKEINHLLNDSLINYMTDSQGN